MQQVVFVAGVGTDSRVVERTRMYNRGPAKGQPIRTCPAIMRPGQEQQPWHLHTLE